MINVEHEKSPFITFLERYHDFGASCELRNESG